MTLLKNSFIFEKFFIKLFNLDACLLAELIQSHSMFVLILGVHKSRTLFLISSFCFSFLVYIEDLFHVPIDIGLSLGNINTVEHISQVLLHKHNGREFVILRVGAIGSRDNLDLLLDHQGTILALLAVLLEVEKCVLPATRRTCVCSFDDISRSMHW